MQSEKIRQGEIMEESLKGREMLNFQRAFNWNSSINQGIVEVQFSGAEFLKALIDKKNLIKNITMTDESMMIKNI